MSRHRSPTPTSSSTGDSPIIDHGHPGDASERPSSSSRNRASEGSDGYPSWLPKRPLHPPPPASTIQSSSYYPTAAGGPSDHYFAPGGRKPTPRSVRIISLQNTAEGEKDGRRVSASDHTRRRQRRLSGRVWSRATTAGLSPALFSSPGPLSFPHHHHHPHPQPRFNTPGLQLELLRNPSVKTRLYFYLLRLFVFAHIPCQTFFDFNAVFILFQVAKFPSPEPSGVPGSGKNWALGAAAYVACWFTWIFVVFIVYELVYSFARRWRIKRPLIYPIYLSSPAFNLAAISSYSYFCFLQHVRYSAFFSFDDDDNGNDNDNGNDHDHDHDHDNDSRASRRRGRLHNDDDDDDHDHDSDDWLAETFWFYSQNLPTVALLLPRAGLSLALLIAFSAPQPGLVVLADAGVSTRDRSFFRSDGALTDYSRGVLIANAAWTAWRFVVLVTSWIGLWVLSGHRCAGICGPRYRWEEEEAEKTLPTHDRGDGGDTGSEADALPWSWKERTRMRVQEAYDFCMTVQPLPPPGGPQGPQMKWEAAAAAAAGMREVSSGGGGGASELLGPSPASVVPFEGMEQVLAAVGFPSSPAPARRGVLSEDLFTSPKMAAAAAATTASHEFSDVLPKVVKRSSKEKPVAGPSAPLMALPYPFVGHGSQVSSKDRVPFPHSPVPSGEKAEEGEGSEVAEREDEGDGEEEDGDEGDDGEEEEGEIAYSEEPSSGRASGSMSSLGQPVISRYPFQFRLPVRTTSPSSGTPSHLYPQHPGGGGSGGSPTNISHSSPSHLSRSTRSTGNRESTDSQSPRSAGGSSGMASSPTSQMSGIPMPPRHPQQGRGRTRAGTVPSVVQMSPVPVVFPRGGRTHGRTLTDTSFTEAFGGPHYQAYDTTMDGEDDDQGEEVVTTTTTTTTTTATAMMDQPEPEGPYEAAERDDIVGLLSLSAAPSPGSSIINLRLRPGALSSPHRRGHGSSSRSRSKSRSNSHSGSGSGSSSSRSRAASMSVSLAARSRSRAQSLVQSIGAASRSSLDLVQAMRLRANSSMARLEEDVPPPPQSHSRSGSGSDAVVSSGGGSSSENHTFGHPLRTRWPARGEEGEEFVEEEPPAVPQTIRGSPSHPTPLRSVAVSAPALERRSEPSISLQMPTPVEDPVGVPVYEADGLDAAGLAVVGSSQRSDVISTAPQSLITPPASVEGVTDSSGRTLSSWGRTSHHMLEHPGQPGPA